MASVTTSGRRRAPRLGPTDRIASHLERRGRFAKLNPLEGRPLPSLPKLAGAVGWAALLGGSGYTAWKRWQERGSTGA